MKKHIVRIVVFLSVGLAASLVANSLRPTGGIGVLRPSAEALALQAGITPIHLDTAKLLLENKKVLFLDARPANVYKRGRIPGSANFPEEDFADRIKAFKDTVPLDRPIVTYCSGEECRASELLAKELQKEGYKYIHLFFGGWVEWTQAKERIEK
jgi:rhodanese-related sulfurtransferase